MICTVLRAGTIFILPAFFDYIDMGSVLCVEWSENIENALPENTVRVYIEKGDSDNARIIRIDGVKDENSLC